MDGSNVCRFHGGKSLKGPAHPAYKNGRYSKVLPRGLAARYTEFLADPEILALDPDIALIDTRIDALIGRMPTGETLAGWAAAGKAAAAISAAVASGNAKDMLSGLKALEDALIVGRSEASAWSEIVDLIERRRRLSETERKRRVDMQQMITAEQALAMIGLILETIRKHVRDRDALAAIAADIAVFTAGPPG